jgi:hypothetical protein
MKDSRPVHRAFTARGLCKLRPVQRLRDGVRGSRSTADDNVAKGRILKLAAGK